MVAAGVLLDAIEDDLEDQDELDQDDDGDCIPDVIDNAAHDVGGVGASAIEPGQEKFAVDVRNNRLDEEQVDREGAHGPGSSIAILWPLDES